MAAYYHSHHHNPGTSSTEIQDHNTNNFHTLILMNPNLADPQPPPPPPSSHNILLLNSAATVAAGLTPQHGLLPQHQFVRLPTSPPQPSNITLYGYPSHEARDIPRARQGLSLSLSSQNPALGGGSQQGGEADVAGGGQGLVLGSKYLKAAQELLEEVVHVGDDGGVMFKSSSIINTDVSPKKENKSTVAEFQSEEKDKHSSSGGGGQLSTAERQEIQMKKAKLVTMLDEAEQRYRQYNHQMQIVIESFEQAAGMGSAKTYTALALKTISKQFRCLKDAIQGQIRAANKMLGDDQEGGLGSLAGGKIEGSRLKYIDHQIRQQRALQQLGMMQNPNAWRPQRGLPERSVSVLRAWLFEHFLHPYPKDSDKIMLAKQTGLSRSQVSNWFINARVRLWKPMIEEMYTEEIKEQEHSNGLSEEKLGSSSKENSNNEENAGALNSIKNQEKIDNIDENHQFKSCKDQNNAAAAAAAVVATTSSFIGIPTSATANTLDQNQHQHQHQHGFTLTGSLEMEGGISQRSPKRQRNDEVLHYDDSNGGEIMIKFGNEKQGRVNGNEYPIISGGMNFIGAGGSDEKQGRENGNGYPIISGGMNFIGMGGGELGAYPIGEMGRFEAEDFSQPPRFLHGNGISLSLGLPPSCENHHQQQLENLSATNHTFLSHNQNIQFRRPNDFGTTMSSPSSHSSAAAFECIDIQNRKGFAAQLLPDYVA